MGNVSMEARDINYRGGETKMSVEDALKSTSGEAAAIAALQEAVGNLQTDTGNLQTTKANLITIAPVFSAETAYDPGDLVYYNGLTYRCVNAHEGDWDADDFAATTISGELATLKSGLTNVTSTAVGSITFFKVGKIVMLIMADGVINTNSGNEVMNGDNPLVIPEGYRPVSTVNFSESYQNKRMVVNPSTGKIIMPNDQSSTNITVRVSTVWITA